MANEPRIISNGSIVDKTQLSGENHSPQNEARQSHQETPNLKQNAAQLLDRNLQNLQAHNRKNDLLSKLPHEQKGLTENKQLFSHQQKTEKLLDKTLETANQTLKNIKHDLSKPEVSSKFIHQNLEKTEQTLDKTEKHFEKLNSETFTKSSRNINQTSETFKQTLDSLISKAREHKDFAQFKNRTEDFWRNVREMSEIKFSKIEIRGETNTRVSSRYGELLERLAREGGRLEPFLNSLSRSERDVFLARYQLEKSFGLNKFFIGNGILLNERGQFDLKTFLQSSGKVTDLPVDIILFLSENDLPIEEFLIASDDAFTDQQVLLNSKSAALLGMSLALFENIDAMLALENLVLNSAAQNILHNKSEFVVNQLLANSFTSNSATNTNDKKINEQVVVGALVNGSLSKTKTSRRFDNKLNVSAWQKGENNTGNFFAAGATGAMIGAAIGCLVPLAESVIGTALNFAASTVIGTADRGLRSVNVNMLISNVVTDGVQRLLTASQNTLPDNSRQAPSFRHTAIDDLQFELSNQPRNTFLPA